MMNNPSELLTMKSRRKPLHYSQVVLLLALLFLESVSVGAGQNGVTYNFENAMIPMA